ncbi:MAG: WYL domain-containing protein [Leptospiraceae bacterium]|nr:WYL domain-containing protein [Leptospiraceae bacterium]
MPENHKEQNWFLKLEDILQVIGLIESKGKYFTANSENTDKAMTTYRLEELLSHFSKTEKSDFGRTIRNAKKLFNSHVSGYMINGNKQGTYIVRKSNGSQNLEEFKEHPAYKTLVIFALAIATYKDQLEWNILHQLFQQKMPLAFICFLIVAIEFQMTLKIEYWSDRKQRNESYTCVPCKIIVREGHWLLIIYDLQKKDWCQILIHSIETIEPLKDSLKQFIIAQNLPKFDPKNFYKDTFTLAKFDDKEPITYVIRVPRENKRAVTKRKGVGKWENHGDYWLWKVASYDKMEVFDYIFRWEGILELVEPKEAREEFYNTLHKLQSIHK